ncbi:uncharacterized protein PGTG_22546 [Puccinia graminis f. sp. tritici CRL 75-36-700-3]|uniref:Uncharacterized protein n=1 Tax=Puccinia graminis f. sp. tritici (strain CRL 75-36-700-3 / race SCCL) TaxID=418459 RepID=H6QV28_PUCGT|nr:uncharacterized protein PGTG_22546 [Puccinia graminis f. sp. tritici CRL 75-36-700-3]EHS62641.1 hypothetical protein PGTG_22546 [Puccinia graminis f. sp. tritici CRL 75-36-700-3]
MKILKPKHEASYKRNIAWLETAAVRVGLLMLESMNHLKKGSNVLVWTNNTTTESVILKRKSGDNNVNEEWKLIQDFLIHHEVDLTGKRVKSGDNIADEFSYGANLAIQSHTVLPLMTIYDTGHQWEDTLPSRTGF